MPVPKAEPYTEDELAQVRRSLEDGGYTVLAAYNALPRMLATIDKYRATLGQIIAEDNHLTDDGECVVCGRQDRWLCSGCLARSAMNDWKTGHRASAPTRAERGEV